jgi:hypothetical protein
MKKYLFTLLLPLVLSVPLFSQASGYDITVSYNRDAAGLTADITVTVHEGTPSFTYFLMTNDPVHGTVIQQSEKTGKRKYTFRDVKPGKYFLRIEDGTGTQTGKTVRIDAQDNQR